MGSPFPGMNPYLENPATWSNLHSRLIVALANLRGPKIRPKYRVAVAVTMPMPDIVRHRCLEIHSLRTSDVITVIEILSPVNKRGAGRQKYKSKRLEILESQTHLVEIDLLHEEKPIPVLDSEQTSYYRVLVSERSTRPQAQLYSFDLQQSIPPFQVPLQTEDQAITVNLKPLLEEIYELSGYDLDIDYSQDPVPKWSASELTWIDELLKAQKLR
ncbi:MAG: DUF4058 family protein [Phormidesmis sp.]